jgi:hypothetical protein
VQQPSITTYGYAGEAQDVAAELTDSSNYFLAYVSGSEYAEPVECDLES